LSTDKVIAMKAVCSFFWPTGYHNTSLAYTGTRTLSRLI